MRLTYNIFINPDMRSNLRRAWANFSQEWIDECPKNIPQLKGCLFTLCFYHALVQGRRRFGQQGWSKKYSFNVGDLTVCAQVLKTWIGRSTYVYQKNVVVCCCTKVPKKDTKSQSRYILKATRIDSESSPIPSLLSFSFHY